MPIDPLGHNDSFWVGGGWMALGVIKMPREGVEPSQPSLRFVSEKYSCDESSVSWGPKGGHQDGVH